MEELLLREAGEELSSSIYIQLPGAKRHIYQSIFCVQGLATLLGMYIVEGAGASGHATHPDMAEDLDLSGSAVHEELDTSDEAGVVRSEKYDRLSDIFRLAQATKRYRRCEMSE